MPVSEKFIETSGGTKIFVRRFDPPEGVTPIAVLHIVHGLAEHSARYRKTAEALGQAGIIVYCHDHRGHGKTHEASGGALPLGAVDAPKGALPLMAADVGELLAAEVKEHPNLRFFVWGHSMGSIISQMYVASGKAVPLASLILSGAPARLPGIAKGPLFALVAVLQAANGEHGFSSVTSKLTIEKWNQQVVKASGKLALTDNDWLSYDKEANKEYADDPWCGFPASIGLWKSMVFQGICGLRQAVAAHWPANLPVLLLHAGEDPVTLNDLGQVSHVQVDSELRSAGKMPPKVIIYPQARHELVNEPIRDEVWQDVIAHIRSLATAPPTSRL